MPEETPKVVKIERGRYSPHFQVVRAWLSAASALAAIDPSQAGFYLDAAIDELTDLQASLRGVR